jgi:hypothetical protein
MDSAKCVLSCVQHLHPRHSMPCHAMPRPTHTNSSSTRAAPGAPRFIAFMYAVTSTMGIWSTMSVSIGDFSRYCKSPNAAWSQLVAIPLLMGTLAVLGTVTAFAASGMYGKELWQVSILSLSWRALDAIPDAADERLAIRYHRVLAGLGSGPFCRVHGFRCVGYREHDDEHVGGPRSRPEPRLESFPA